MYMNGLAYCFRHVFRARKLIFVRLSSRDGTFASKVPSFDFDFDLKNFFFLGGTFAAQLSSAKC